MNSSLLITCGNSFDFRLRLASSILSCEVETKFHHINLFLGKTSQPKIINLASAETLNETSVPFLKEIRSYFSKILSPISISPSMTYIILTYKNFNFHIYYQLFL